MRRLFIALVMALALATLGMGQSQPPSPSKISKPKQQQSSSAHQPSAQQVNPPCPTATADQSSTKHEQEDKKKVHGWHKFVTWPESITAWAIMFTLGAIIWQAIASSTAAKAALRSAIAAKDSAEALKSAERAWIIGSIEKMENLTAWQPDISKVEIFWISPTIKNVGRTPGRITRVRAKALFRMPDEPMQPEATYDLTYQHDYPNKNDGLFTDEVVLVPGASVQTVNVGLSAQDFAKVRSGPFLLSVCGVIDYRDIYERTWYSRFCYEYHIPHGFNPLPEGFYVGGPPGYNKAT
jgi:hypothetical protein